MINLCDLYLIHSLSAEKTLQRMNGTKSMYIISQYILRCSVAYMKCHCPRRIHSNRNTGRYGVLTR